MQPLKIVIPGKFFDTQLYMGRLYAWRVDGSIVTYDWNRLVEKVVNRLGKESRLVIDCAFRRGDYLYGNNWDLFFRDDEIKDLLIRRFDKFAKLPIKIRKSELESCNLGEQDNPLPFPHADSIVFCRRLYSVGPQGLYSAACNGRTIKPVSTRPIRVWDCPAFGLAKSKYWGVAIAAGEEGLFECRPQRNEEPSRADAYTNGRPHRDCTSCEWMFFSVYGSSHAHSGYMLEFSHYKTRNQNFGDLGPLDEPREFNCRKEAGQIFSEGIHKNELDSIEYTWGTHDKICRFTNRQIDVVHFNPWTRIPDDMYKPFGKIPVNKWKGSFVSAQTALFGIVVEFDHCLVVIASESLRPTNIPGEPVNWRVFRHSKYYANQLHVIYDDQVEILSFNHDYFQDQSKKLAGYQYSANAST